MTNCDVYRRQGTLERLLIGRTCGIFLVIKGLISTESAPMKCSKKGIYYANIRQVVLM